MPGRDFKFGVAEKEKQTVTCTCLNRRNTEDLVSENRGKLNEFVRTCW